MTTIAELYEAASKLRLREELPKMIKRTEYPLVLKVVEQHKMGILGTGSKITPSYKGVKYATFKNSLNSAPGYGTPDATLTGAYNAELRVEVKGDIYEIKSGVSYANSASLTQYGPQLNDLTEKSKAEYCDETLLPEIQEYITGITGLTFQ